MNSHVQHIAEDRKDWQSLSLGKRLLLVILVLAIQSIYSPTSSRTTGGFEPRLPIDIFPIWAVWVLPYVLCYILWISSILWALFKMEDQLFRSFIAAFVFTCTVSVSIFIFLPTYVRSSVIAGSDIFSSLLQFIHENWGRYDAFPSGHVYITTLLALFYSRWYPNRKLLWTLIVIIVSFSTLFTGQHYVADIFGGLLVAYAGYHVGLRWTRLFMTRNQPAKPRLLLPPSS